MQSTSKDEIDRPHQAQAGPEIVQFERLFEEKLKKLEEDMTPFGFLDMGEDDLSEAARLLASEPHEKPKHSRRDRSWLDDANEVM